MDRRRTLADMWIIQVDKSCLTLKGLRRRDDSAPALPNFCPRLGRHARASLCSSY